MMTAIFGAFGLFVSFIHDLRDLFADRTGRSILLVASTLILIGTLFYSMVEGWTFVDSFYFSVVTLTTVGFGDFYPDTTAGKLFTTVYIFLGLSVIATFASSIAKTHAKRLADLASQDNDEQNEDATPQYNGDNRSVA